MTDPATLAAQIKADVDALVALIPQPTTAAGIAAGGTIQNEDATTLGKDLDAIKASNAKWLRIDINWAQVQGGGSTSWNWTSDALIKGALSRGLKVLATIVYAPSWAKTSGQVDPAAYGTFVKAAVARYAPQGVHAYEIWNEANTSWGWTTTPSVSVYVACLRAAYASAKAADPSCTVISAGLSPSATSNGNYSPCDFLAALYANGAKGYFDAVGAHPYCQPAAPGDAQAWSAWYQMVGASTSMRTIMAANGESAKNIWVTEFGNFTAGTNAVSQSTQAAWVTKAFTLAKSYGWLPVFCYYMHRDTVANPTTDQGSYGLLNNDFSQKPAYAAFQTAMG